MDKTNIAYRIDRGNDAIAIDIYMKDEINDCLSGGGIKEMNMPAIY